MADQHESQERLAALLRPTGDREAPDPTFWGAEPRPVRRPARSEEERASSPGWWTDLVDRVRDLRVEVGLGIVALVVVVAVAGVVWYRMGVAGGSGSAPPASAAPKQEPAHTTPTSPAPAAATSNAAHRGPTVIVHVAGAVAHPGVLEMPAGARVIDAVEGAGGGLPDADLDRINLAAALVDGQRILVVKVGAAPVADASPPDGALGADSVIDLNTATSAQLEELPGIGPALAGAILSERDRRGGFRSVNELREVRGIGDARFAELRDRVAV